MQLSARARDAGVLTDDAEFRDSSSLLDNTLAYMGAGLSEQFAASLAENDVQLVVMNGGGADIILGSCEEIDEQCSLLTDSAQAAEELFVEMAENGTKNVIYVFYPNPEAEEQKEMMDALRPLAEATCHEAPLTCLFLDLRPVFEGSYAEYILEDGRNPTDAGADVTAGEIWSLLADCLLS